MVRILVLFEYTERSPGRGFKRCLHSSQPERVFGTCIFDAGVA